jgi:hypothetical protein
MEGSIENNNVKYCNAEFSDHGNTSCMRSHINSKHKNIKMCIYEVAKSQRERSIKNAYANINVYKGDSERHKNLTNAVVEFLVETNQPLSLVDNPSFIKMLNKFDNKYKLPCRQTITQKNIIEKFESVKQIVQKELDTADYVSLTLDGWSSVSNNSYLGITSHYIDEDFEFQSCLLALKYAPMSHTGVNLSNEI